MQHGRHLDEELPNSARCLSGLKLIREAVFSRINGRFELFDFGIEVGITSSKGIDSELERLTRTCIWQAIAVKTEFSLKLLYTIEGYLSAVDAKNPVSTFLLARYLLELVATISAIDFELQSCVNVPITQWARRGTTFALMLNRARFQLPTKSSNRFLPSTESQKNTYSQSRYRKHSRLL
jgi:hypothetical protein